MYGGYVIFLHTMFQLLRPTLVVLSLTTASLLNPAPVSAFWIWTPQKGKFERSSAAFEKSAKTQFESGHQLFEAGEYDKAIRELNKVIKHYPYSGEAPEAAYLIGLSQEETGKYYEAFLSYQGVLDNYPQTERIHEIVERQFRIANLFFKEEKKKLAGMTIPMLPSSARNRAMEIYQEVVDSVPFGPYAATAYYHMGLISFQDEKYAQAILRFDRILEDFPSSLEAEQAELHIGLSLFHLAELTEYGSTRVGAALEKLEGFVRHYPESDEVGQAEELIIVLVDNLAEERYNIAAFYEKQNFSSSAQVYYRDVVEKFPDTSWAKLARDKLDIRDPGVEEAVP